MIRRREQGRREQGRREPGGKAEVIGIAGSGPGVGTTHFAILTANYLADVLRRRTAVLEWNQSGAFARMEAVCVKKTVSRPENNTFRIFEVSYIKKAGKKELLECMNCGYDTVIIDFGSGFESAAEEILRCERRFLLGSFCEWQVGAFTSFAAGRRGKREGWEYFYRFGSEEAAEEMRKRLCISVRRIPESQDAFTITGELMVFFEGFLND